MSKRNPKGTRSKQNGAKKRAETSQGTFKDTLVEQGRTNIDKRVAKDANPAAHL